MLLKVRLSLEHLKFVVHNHVEIIICCSNILKTMESFYFIKKIPLSNCDSHPEWDVRWKSQTPMGTDYQ